MKITETEIKGVFIIEPNTIGDNRGWFVETFRADKMKAAGLTTDFVQENHSFSAVKGTLRGLHFQNFPRAQTKLLRCTKGAILDVAVDLRKDSPTFKKHVAVELSETNKKQLYIPRGCGHGFLTLTENCEVQYKVDDYYSPKHDRSIRFDDSDFGINWGAVSASEAGNPDLGSQRGVCNSNTTKQTGFNTQSPVDSAANESDSHLGSRQYSCNSDTTKRPDYDEKHHKDLTASMADKPAPDDQRAAHFILSDKDKNAPLFKDSDANFDARVLVTGGDGQLGRDVVSLLQSRGINHLSADRKDFDITDGAATDKFIRDYCPTIIIHCAAYTAVDKAESERELCFDINVTGSKNIAAGAAAIGAKVVYISSDYVYGGTGETPLTETDACKPLNYYGETKLLGEKEVAARCDKHFILRTSWVFGKNGNNFVKVMQRLSAEGRDISVVADQIGSPTYTVDLAAAILDIMFSDKYGVYNVSNEGFCSWADFADLILNRQVKRIKTSEYKTAAARPLNSRMSKDKLEDAGFCRLPTWQDASERYKNEK